MMLMMMMMMMMTCHICGYDDGGDNDFDLVDDGNIKDEFFVNPRTVF